jgi:hypothetical protein
MMETILMAMDVQVHVKYRVFLAVNLILVFINIIVSVF